MLSDAYGLAPGEAVVLGTAHHELGRGFRLKTAAGGKPFVHARLGAVCPGGKEQKVSRGFIYQDTGVSYAVFALGQTAPFAHIHGYNHGPPGASAVGGTGHANVNVFLEVEGTVVTNVVAGYQRAVLGGHQARNTVGCHAVISFGAHAAGQPVLVDTGLFYLETAGPHHKDKGLGEVLDGLFLNIHVKKAVLHIIVVQSLLRQADKGHPPVRRCAGGGNHLGHGHVLARHHRHLQVVKMNKGGRQKGHERRYNHTTECCR